MTLFLADHTVEKEVYAFSIFQQNNNRIELHFGFLNLCVVIPDGKTVAFVLFSGN